MQCDNWGNAKRNFIKWWNAEATERPLMRIVAKRDKPLGPPVFIAEPASEKERYLDPARHNAAIRNHCLTHRYMADAFPSVDLNLGAGSIAVYLGCEPIFKPDTIWFSEFTHSPEDFDIRFKPENRWLVKHLEIFERAQKLAGGDYLVSIPDLIENIDILSALRGPQDFCFDLVDEPELVHRAVRQLDEIYFKYYDLFYNIVKDKEGSASYTAFAVWGPGRVAKVQCDFSAMMSPDMYREFVLPSLRKQCTKLDYSLYHLDGPGAVQHVDALMEIQELNALQWTAGAGQPDAGNTKWYPIYDKVRRAGKSLWIYICDGTYEDWVKSADRMISTYGNRGIYFIFPEMTENQAERLIAHAEDQWYK